MGENSIFFDRCWTQFQGPQTKFSIFFQKKFEIPIFLIKNTLFPILGRNMKSRVFALKKVENTQTYGEKYDFFGQFSTKFQGQISKIPFFDEKKSRNSTHKVKFWDQKMTQKST